MNDLTNLFTLFLFVKVDLHYTIYYTQLIVDKIFERKNVLCENTLQTYSECYAKALQILFFHENLM